MQKNEIAIDLSVINEIIPTKQIVGALLDAIDDLVKEYPDGQFSELKSRFDYHYFSDIATQIVETIPRLPLEHRADFRQYVAMIYEKIVEKKVDLPDEIAGKLLDFIAI